MKKGAGHNLRPKHSVNWPHARAMADKLSLIVTALTAYADVVLA